MPSERIQRRIDSLLDEADEAVSKLDWATVRDRARAVLGLDPGNSDAIAYIEAAERELEGLASPGSAAQGTSTPTTQSVPATDQPTSFADGRYQVQKFLGEGGKKMVYLAQDTLLDRDVVSRAVGKCTSGAEQNYTTGHRSMSMKVSWSVEAWA